MKAKIKHSPHAEVRPDTIGEVIGRIKDSNSFVVEVEGHFTVAGATPMHSLGKRQLAFDAHELEFIREAGGGMGMEMVFCQGFDWMATESHANAVQKGFWEDRDAIEKLAAAHGLGEVARKLVDSQLRELIHSEVSEACEGDRKDLQDDHLPAFTMVECEMADALIRIADYSKKRGLRVGQAVIAKMKYNANRPYKHGKKF